MKQSAEKLALDPYYPLVTGYEWIYADMLTDEMLVYALDKIRLTPSGGVVSFASNSGSEEFLISRKNLYRPDNTNSPILRFPFREGKCWSYEDAELGTVWCQVHGPEEVETPAGRLRDSYRLEHRAWGEVFLIEWYAWEIGLVRWVERQGAYCRSYALSGLVCL